MANELQMIGSTIPTIASKRGNYEITTPFQPVPVELKRDVHFGKIPKTKQPVLFKAGSEAIIQAYGLLQHYELISKTEDLEKPFFRYVFRCDLVKIGANGEEYVFCSGYGSANTLEKRNGFNDAYNADNSTIKIAKKRSMVDAAINVAGLSSMFSQDEDNETFMDNAKLIYDSTSDDAPINTKQVRRIFALAGENGLNAEQAKQKLNALGFASTKDVKQKDYDYVCGVLAGTIEPKADKTEKKAKGKANE